MKQVDPDAMSFLCSTSAAFLFGILFLSIQYGSEEFAGSRAVVIIAVFTALIGVFSIIGVAVGWRAINKEGFSLLQGLAVQQNALGLIIATVLAARYLF